MYSHRTIGPSEQRFSGIGGGSNKSCGSVQQLCVVGRLTINYVSDLIGGSGSWCPMLLGLPPLIQHRTTVMHGLLDNQDGLMMLQPEVEQESTECESTGDKNNETYCFRLLYTDSGHYLLPTDDPQA